MNSVILTGRPTKDPDIRYTSGETQRAVAHLTIACNRSGQKDKADFIPCVAWDKTAELIEKYVKKGKLIGVTGMMVSGSYQKDGNTVYTLNMAIEKVEFLESKTEKKEENRDPEQVDFTDVEGIDPF